MYIYTHICLANSPVPICSEGDKVGEKDKTVWKWNGLGAGRDIGEGSGQGVVGIESSVGETGRCLGDTWTGRCVERMAGGTACEEACGDAANN